MRFGCRGHKLCLIDRRFSPRKLRDNVCNTQDVLTAACWPEPLPIHREACPANNAMWRQLCDEWRQLCDKWREIETFRTDEDRPWTKSWPSISPLSTFYFLHRTKKSLDFGEKCEVLKVCEMKSTGGYPSISIRIQVHVIYR